MARYTIQGLIESRLTRDNILFNHRNVILSITWGEPDRSL